MDAPLTKVCTRCSHELPSFGFSRNRRRSDGLAQWCKPCMADYRREYGQRPEVKKRAAKQALVRYHALSKDEKLRIQSRRRGLARYLKTKYGIDLARYEEILAAQESGCAMCRRPPPEGKRLAVDHDHACCPGEVSCGACVRGLLCTTCNTWLGFYEKEEWKAMADTYLEREIARREKEGK